MKAFTKFIAVAVATVGILSVAGCGKKTPDNRTVTSANWNVRTSASTENNFTQSWTSKKEVATYNIKFNKGINSTYSVEYNDGGVFTTEFYMTTYDWNDGNIPEGYAPADKTAETVYVYKTSLNISGKYVYAGNGAEKPFEDKVETVCYYRLAGENLQPVYSEQTIQDTAPNSLNAADISNAYIEVDGVYKTYYNGDCTKATVIHKDNKSGEPQPTVKEVNFKNKKNYSVFDNSQLRAAVRAFNITEGASHTFNVFTPQNGTLQMSGASCSAPTMLDLTNEEQKGIAGALDKSTAGYIFFNGENSEDENRTYRYNSVTLSLNEKMAGSVPTYWYATVENKDVNYSKAVLLRMATPVSFGLGTLIYTLSDLKLEDVQ